MIGFCGLKGDVLSARTVVRFYPSMHTFGVCGTVETKCAITNEKTVREELVSLRSRMPIKELLVNRD